LYEEGQKLLGDHPSFAAIEGQHRRVHQLATRLLKLSTEGCPIGVSDYELFTSAVKTLRLESTSLKHELEDRLAHLDPLTGLNNRTSVLSVLRESQALVERKVIACSVAMMDLDHFKKVNDAYGHQAGDLVLIACARHVMQNLRPYDNVFRYGGEEFVIVIQDADGETALAKVDQLRQGLAQLPIYNNNTLINVTASFGVAQLEPQFRVEQSLDHADQALYDAKSAGRNCARLWKQTAQTT